MSLGWWIGETRKGWGLPAYDWPLVPQRLADDQRRAEIAAELAASEAGVLITLGDQPLRWFARHFGSRARLSAYGRTIEEYGRLHRLQVGDREIWLLPLVHPRQAAKLGSHSSGWSGLHSRWSQEAPRIADLSVRQGGDAPRPRGPQGSAEGRS